MYLFYVTNFNENYFVWLCTPKNNFLHAPFVKGFNKSVTA